MAPGALGLFAVAVALGAAPAQAQQAQSGQQAQQAGPAGAAGARRGPIPCNVLLDGINQGMAEKMPEAFVAAANVYESGRCGERNDQRALELLGQAARMGHPPAVRRMARRFALGNGVPQSYANAGAWLSGKGGTDEPLQPWDYSIGFAHAVVSELMVTAGLPASAVPEGVEARLVIEVDARHPTALQMRPTAEDAARHEQMYGALRSALEAALPRVLARLKPTERSLITAARVALPVALRARGPGQLDVLEDVPILR